MKTSNVKRRTKPFLGDSLPSRARLRHLLLRVDRHPGVAIRDASLLQLALASPCDDPWLPAFARPILISFFRLYRLDQALIEQIHQAPVG